MNKKIIVIALVLSFIFLSCETVIALHIEKETNETMDGDKILIMSPINNDMDRKDVPP
ncbi:MAG: hypothetical protein MUO82_00215 [Candidatus Thermoplasmatota archaeon]|nr:hypothetical protein [Candidatus Thermoplasmatota archaeon]